MPLVTIILPVKNGAEFIEDAIKSILNQSFTNFELLIFNDQSTDNTLSLIEQYSDDHRIQVFNDQTGFIQNLNSGISRAKGKYIARMDADDVMSEDRLKIQVELMTQHPEIDICGTWIKVFGVDTPATIQQGMADRIETPLITMILGNILSHPTVMIKKAFLDTHKLQYTNYQYAEDYKLWVDIAKKKGVFFIIPKPLLNYRLSRNQVSRLHHARMTEQSNHLQKDIIEYLLMHYPSGDEGPDVKKLYHDLSAFKNKNLISFDNITKIFFQIFKKAAPFI